MLKPRWILMTAFVSLSAFGVSLEEKQNRVQYLEELSSKAVSMNIDAYRRELEYEKQNLSVKKRAENEANLLAEKIKVQVVRAYEAALLNKTSQDAYAEVKNAIENDLGMIASDLQEDIRSLSLSALDAAQSGAISLETELSGIEKVLLKGVKERHKFLNDEAEYELPPAMLLDATYSTGNPTKDSERKEYSQKREILESLVSDRESTAWVPTSNMNLRSEDITKQESKVSIQLKVEYLGLAIEAGPTISFKREFSTNVNVLADGLHPVLLADGNFDFLKRDVNGKVIVKSGQQQRRFLSFSCDAVLSFESEYSGSGGFSILGVGLTDTVSKTYKNLVSLSSRRIRVPEYIAGKSVTYKYLQSLCHSDFLSAQITNNMTVATSLDMMMKNVIASLRFSHPKTKCVVDRHCVNWYNNEIIGLSRKGNYPRCIEESREKYRACELRGLKGQNCSVFDANGKRVSDGSFEFTCDVGLRCVKVQQEGWFKNWEIYQYAKGKCMPINAKTYRAP